MNVSEIGNQRYLQVLGENLQSLAERLMANQTLLRYLYYEDKDPLDPKKPDVLPSQVFHKQVLIVPVIGNKTDSKSIISLRVVKGEPNIDNTEYMEIYFDVEVFVPITQWVVKSDNLRPFLIMSEISKSLSDKKIKGLGKIVYDVFSLNFLTEEMAAYNMLFHFTQYN